MHHWSGEILVSNEVVIKDLYLSSATSVLYTPLPHSSLRYLAIVDIAHVPLYLAAGPSLDVSTNSTETEDWFNSILLDDAAVQDIHGSIQSGENGWWHTVQAQSSVGILAQVSPPESVSQDSARITEILFYGTVSASAERSVEPVELRVHALALSSDLLYKAPSINTPPLSPVCGDDPSRRDFNGQTEAQFLTPFGGPQIPSAMPNSKRKSVTDVFDAATEWRKKARRRGGESVVAAASRVEDMPVAAGPRRCVSVGSNADIDVESRKAATGWKNQNGNGHSDERSKAATASEVYDSPLLPQSPVRSPSQISGFPLDARPASRKGPPDGLSKRSSLCRVTSIVDADGEATVEERNKDAISRLVMAGMRLYGLQQRRKSTKLRRSSMTPEVSANDKEAEEVLKDEEYKLVYHQTYKGAVFAFRKYISTSPLYLHPDRLRATVDELLAIFCVDPLPHNETGFDTVHAFGMFPGESAGTDESTRALDARLANTRASNPP